jgi:hypothetical protein
MDLYRKAQAQLDWATGYKTRCEHGDCMLDFRERRGRSAKGIQAIVGVGAGSCKRLQEVTIKIPLG